MGVAPAYFDENGEFVMRFGGSSESALVPSRYSSQTTGPKENADNVRAIIARLREINPGVQIFLTLSPVPLKATFERASAVIADCVSKSTLRLAADQVCAEEAGRRLVYWPSFEIVRWLSPHFDRDQPPPFGAEDGNTRHVSRWLIRQIVKLFVDFHSVRPAKQAASDEGS